MSLSEFSLIDRFFAAQAKSRDDVAVGIGDDAAVVDVPPDQQLVAAVDTLVAGVHFPPTASAASIGHKALAVNLSDLAAMGARPAWALLALTLPKVDEVWIEEFAAGFFALADRFGVALVGGDTTQGPLSVSVQLFGCVPKGQAVQRRGAQPGDQIFVSGTLGDAGLALRQIQSGATCPDALAIRLHTPEPRVQLGERLRGLATAAIDVSDGLLADLGHILARSGVGARVRVDHVPRSAAFQSHLSITDGDWYALPLSAGDDYELCFTVPLMHSATLHALADDLRCPITHVGEIVSEPGLKCLYEDGRAYVDPGRGYEHFRT